MENKDQSIMVNRSICISVERYDELVKKEKAYDTYAKHLKEKDYGYELEKALFGVSGDDF